MCESVNIKVRVASVSINSGNDSPFTRVVFPEFSRVEMHAEEDFLKQMPFH